jgi:hypothetical protein
MDTSLPDPTRRSTPGLVAVALGATASAVVVGAALAGHSFSAVEVFGLLAVAAVILVLNLQRAPSRSLLPPLRREWTDDVVVRAPRARDARSTGEAAGSGHAA